MSVPAARLQAMPSLAEVAQTALPFSPDSFVMTPEGVLGIAKPPRPARLHFVADDLPFNIAVSFDGERSRSQIWAEVGHIPYTAQSPERRRQLLGILRAIQTLKHAKFLVQEGQKILLFSESQFSGQASPEDLIHQTILALQEARPFLRLLAPYL
ncbi:hypothetical protein [Azospirillum sp. sgz302134]